MNEIWGIILAAGESKRMKEPKMLLQFGGKTIIEKVIENVRNSVINDYIVIVGAYREKICSVIGSDTVRCCYNTNYKQGMLSSVQCGIGNLPDECRAVVVFLGDQPVITSGIIDLVIDGYRRSGKGIVMPVFDNKRGHPVLLDSKYFKVIIEIEPERGLRAVAEDHEEDVYEVFVDTSAVLRDIDTKADYIRELKQNK